MEGEKGGVAERQRGSNRFIVIEIPVAQISEFAFRVLISKHCCLSLLNSKMRLGGLHYH
jgi:hypothetical protein